MQPLGGPVRSAVFVDGDEGPGLCREIKAKTCQHGQLCRAVVQEGRQKGMCTVPLYICNRAPTPTTPLFDAQRLGKRETGERALIPWWGV
ncbi:hypothetical protein SKAU_G00351950 [Synaphobranchus kaupii]|uniref:Uncharacterized protein n=1 Tax=Synaphobranchus kaupii TaxID=118154 RepID=A0A9Q1II14_SYNKA|nr:hypothetical protein SKAU_G00351950 [Synaphobranchus kaupii]